MPPIARRTRASLEQNSSAHPLPVLTLSSKIAVQDHVTKKWDRYGTIIEVQDNRSYLVKLASGRVWRRNLEDFYVSAFL